MPPYFVVVMRFDNHTGRVKRHTFFVNRCVGKFCDTQPLDVLLRHVNAYSLRNGFAVFRISHSYLRVRNAERRFGFIIKTAYRFGAAVFVKSLDAQTRRRKFVPFKINLLIISRNLYPFNRRFRHGNRLLSIHFDKIAYVRNSHITRTQTHNNGIYVVSGNRFDCAVGKFHLDLHTRFVEFFAYKICRF